MKKIFPVLLISILLSACGGAPGNISTPGIANSPVGPSTQACSPPTSWTIQYHRTGGFGGFNESMTLDSGGRLTVQSERPPTDEESVISGDQVEAISDLLAEACPFDVEPDQGGCADCFLYELTIQMNGRTFSVQVTDVTLSDDLQPLISTLSQLLQGTE
jgi:hypothetical protein